MTSGGAKFPPLQSNHVSCARNRVSSFNTGQLIGIRLMDYIIPSILVSIVPELIHPPGSLSHCSSPASEANQQTRLHLGAKFLRSSPKKERHFAKTMENPQHPVVCKDCLFPKIQQPGL